MPDDSVTALPAGLQRYSRQILFESIGEAGQQKLLDARVLLIGCGALGTILADTLVRAGVGHLRLCDRDFIERDNLQRQVLFDEEDIAANLPKAEAAGRKLRIINSEVEIETIVVDVNHSNIESLAENYDLILDGTDNFETRFLINDLSVKTRRPWIYGAVIGSTGLCMTVLPNDTPCLRCVFEEAPPPEMNPTCDTAGVLASTVHVVTSLQVVEAIKLLVGRKDEVNRHLVHIDVWTGRFVNMNVQSSYDEGNCPCCKQNNYAYLNGEMGSTSAALCGRNAVQVNQASGLTMNLKDMAKRLATVAAGPVTANDFLVRARIDSYEVTLFADGRAIVKGTDDPDQARSIYAKYVGA